jgi:hypothetical protein
MHCLLGALFLALKQMITFFYTFMVWHLDMEKKYKVKLSS